MPCPQTSSSHSGNTCAGPYKDTVNLPQTSFNMRANSKQREPELQRFWEEQNIYEQLLQTNPGVSYHHMPITELSQYMMRTSALMTLFILLVQDIFTLHDGPPYANG